MGKQLHRSRLVSLALFIVLLSFLFFEEGSCYDQYSFLPSSGTTGSSSPDNFARLKGRLFFRANDGITGRELWSTDGSKAGTKLFSDLYLGSSGFVPDGLTVVKNRLFFKPNYVSDASLWVSDGTKKGTKRLQVPGTQSVRLPFVPLGNRLIYTRTADSGAGIELWALNAGSLTAKLLASNWTSGADFRTGNGTHAIWFVPDQTGSGHVWITDGTPKGTRRVLGIPGSSTTFPIMNVLARGGTFIVTRSGNGVGDTEFYSTNGITGTLLFTLSNVTLSRDGPLGSFLSSNRLVFAGTTSEEGWGIYATNLSGTATKIFDTPLNSVVEFVTSSRVNGRAVFTADKLYSTDGTAAGTRALTSSAVLHPQVIGSISGSLIFLSTDFTTAALYRTDGTPAGTRRLWTGDSFTYSGNGAFGKRTFFGCSNSTNKLGEELCVTDGTVRGTGVFKDLNRIDIAPLYGIAPVTRDQRTVAFIYNSSIWTANGNSSGTRRVPNPQPVSSFVAGVGSLSGWIFYVDSDGFWKYEGSSRNITRISDNVGIPIAATTTHVFLRSPISRESYAFYSYNGTGTPLSLGILTADPTFAVFENYLILAGSRNGSGTELVVSDGLTLTLLKDLNPGGNSSNPRSFALAPELDAIIFVADSPTPSLWKTDGTEDGTVLLHELPATSVLSRTVPGIAEVADRGVFILMPVARQDNGLFTYGLFLFDTDSGEISNSLRQFQSVEGFEVASTGDRFVFILYFRTVEGQESSQLWSSDGTRVGTFPERAPATNFFQTSLLTAPDRRAFFVASSPAEGEELWYIRSSSLRLAPGPSIPGPFGSNPRNLVVIGNRLYFTALTPRGVAQVFTLRKHPSTF